MDSNEEVDALQGARDKCIYSLKTFVNQDGFKVEEHTPIDDKDASPEFYGFYLINTEIGPIDRYFRFKDEKNIADCFDSFRTLAELDAQELADAMKKEAEMIEAQEAENLQADAESQAVRAAPAPAPAPPPVSEEPPPVNAQLLDENGYPVT